MGDEKKFWRVFFYNGFNSSTILRKKLQKVFYKLFISSDVPYLINNNTVILIIGGLLVGIGTQIGMGCTSGHGVCGISRFSVRSIIATISFIFSGVVVVYLMNMLGLN